MDNYDIFAAALALDEGDVPTQGRTYCLSVEMTAKLRQCSQEEALEWLDDHGSRLIGENDEFLGLWAVEGE